MNNSKILIIGSNGMLGQRLTDFFTAKNKNILAVSFEDKSFDSNLDYLQTDLFHPEGIKKIIRENSPDIIINVSAYTAVDKAEVEVENAFAINATAIGEINNLANELGIHFINISTDYVFDGKSGPYSESDEVNPLGVYGSSKLEGENILLKSSSINTIIRTNVLYGPAKYGRPDFVKWVVNSLKSNSPIKIVTDQINNPTYLDDLVDGIFKISENRATGIYNIGGAEFLSRYDFTLRIADYFNLDKKLITPIVTAELNQPAKRPLKSGLLIDKAKNDLNYEPISIEESLEKMHKELNLT